MSGSSVSISDDGLTVAIGAPGYAESESSGLTQVYQYDGSEWMQLGQDIYGEGTDDKSGYSVSLSANGLSVAIGATQNDGNGENSGHVRVYGFDESALT